VKQVSDAGYPSGWIAEKIKMLLSNKVCADGNVHYPGHPWSIVKLLLLGGWVYVYTTIIPIHFVDYQFVDLLAGCGTTRIKETNDVVLGSSLVAVAFAQTPFKRYVLLESDSERYAALNERMKYIEGECKIIKGNCNEQIDSIFANQKTHSLVFVDNEGFDVIWDSIEVILKAKADILINFPTAMVSRTTDPRTSHSLDRFYGDRSWLNATSREDFPQIYMKKLAKRFRELKGSEPYISRVRIGSESYFYDMILICKSGSFVNAWEWLKRKLDWQDPKTIQTTLDILMNRAKSLTSFIDGLGQKVNTIRQKPKRNKTTLEEYL
jgi:three-Cys-motif partner protein